VERAVVRGHRAPGEAESSAQELAPLVEHGATAQKIPSVRFPRSCGGFERHAVALAFKEVDRATRNALAVLPIAVIGTQLSIDRVIREDMVRRAQERLFDGQYGHDRMRCEPYEMEVRSSLPAATE
jgi:hypothetical protein